MAGEIKLPDIVSPSLCEIISCINSKRSFLLEAGAGSGKTWSLIESLRYILKHQKEVLVKNNQKIVCITYTNAAKDEISSRIDYNSLVVIQTIHEFLWSIIKNYQLVLKKELIIINNNSKKIIEGLEITIHNIEVTYSEYGRDYEKGRLFHDDIITLSGVIFEKYKKISEIMASQYPYVFIDEYQDTEEVIVKLLLDGLLKNNLGSLVVGFFGDSSQKIYTKGIGVIKDSSLVNINKQENYRCSKSVIKLLNKIRPNLQQIPAGNNLEGKISFFHCNNILGGKNNYETVLEYLKAKLSWKHGVENLKILMLTHKGIAHKLDYSNLLKVYLDRSSFGRERLYEKQDIFSDLFFNKIETICFLYKEKMYGDLIDFIGKEKYRLHKHSDKEKIQRQINQLNKIRQDGTIGDVLKYVFNNELIAKPNKIYDFEDRIAQSELDEKSQKDKNFYEALMPISYQEVINLGEYMKDNTPFSTKHGVKGAEFNNVLVVIDDTAWKQYSFNHVFCNNQDKSQFDRTLNLLYVCCSRSKNNLALLSLSEIDTKGLQTIESWFEKENVYDVATLVSETE